MKEVERVRNETEALSDVALEERIRQLSISCDVALEELMTKLCLSYTAEMERVRDHAKEECNIVNVALLDVMFLQTSHLVKLH